MPDVIWAVTGVSEVSRTLEKAGATLEDMTAANRAAAAIFTPVARARAPHDTGALAGATQPAATKTQAGVENHLPYFGPIHYGWPAHNIEANPFVDRAVEDTVDQWLRVYEDAVQHACDQVKGA